MNEFKAYKRARQNGACDCGVLLEHAVVEHSAATYEQEYLFCPICDDAKYDVITGEVLDLL
jgi:Zn finger protein HypA/HybF involved in hydrogenase expression